MRPLLLVAVLLSSVVCARAAEDLVTRASAEWREAASFDRIGEYFGHGENTGGHRILRTHAETRAGFYFLVRLASSAPADARFEVQVIAPNKPEPKIFTFPAASPAGEKVFELGLTGADWPGGEKARPVAWRVALLAADGHPLGEQKSFLWENPAK